MRRMFKDEIALMKSVRGLAFMLMVFLMSEPARAEEVRIKDLVNVKGVRTNQLIGMGLVVGLKNTGDSAKSLATNKAVANMLTRLGMKTEPSEAVSGNVAGVIATIELPAFSRNGDRVDVRLSTIGDAKSLAGGTLLLTPLRAGDGNVYVMAQGAVVVGQAKGDGAQVLTVALVPAGGSVEQEFIPALAPEGKLSLTLKNPDFTTNTRVADAINAHFKGFIAKSLDPASIDVMIPSFYQEKTVAFISDLESLKVMADHKAIVVLNERTGTVVMGADVVIAPITIAHGDLSIKVGGKASAGAAGGKPTKPNENVVKLGGTTVGQLVETMNALGMKPADLVGILQAIYAAGALQAELKFI